MHYRQTRGLRLRPVPELRTCLAFTPEPPRLHTLNAAAWLVAALADGRDAVGLESEFLARSAPPLSPDQARSQLQQALAMLQRSGIVECTSSEGE